MQTSCWPAESPPDNTPAYSAAPDFQGFLGKPAHDMSGAGQGARGDSARTRPASAAVGNADQPERFTGRSEIALVLTKLSFNGWRMRMQSSWQKRSSSWFPCRSMRCQVRGPGGGAHSPCPAALLHLAAAGAHRRHVAAPSHRVHYPEVRAEAAFRATPVFCGEEVAAPGVSWSLSASSLRILRPRSAGVKGF